MTPEQYNKWSFNRNVWTLEDIPSAWGWTGQDWVSLTQHIYAFQKENGLLADGKLGPQTAALLRKGERTWPNPKRSANQLGTCHPDLIHLMTEARDDPGCPTPFVILEGHRNQEDQDRAFEEGKSKVQWPNGKHNSLPSQAVDIAPWPIDWDNINRFIALSKHIKQVALKLGIQIVYGGDWRTFKDYPHYELKR